MAEDKGVNVVTHFLQVTQLDFSSEAFGGGESKVVARPTLIEAAMMR